MPDEPEKVILGYGGKQDLPISPISLSFPVMTLRDLNCSAEDYNPETCVSRNFILGLRVYQGTASVLGTVGSVMTIMAIAMNKRLHTVPNAYLSTSASLTSSCVAFFCLSPSTRWVGVWTNPTASSWAFPTWSLS
jgi:hypothetical protein